MGSVADSAFGRRGRARSGGHKYNAKRTQVEVEDITGRRLHTFPSRKEAKRYHELDLMRRAGAITDLQIQPRYPIVIFGQPVRYESGVAMVYVADFKYCERIGTGNSWQWVTEDVKGRRKTPRPPGAKKPRHDGTDTDAAKIKRALVEAIYGIKVRVV